MRDGTDGYLIRVHGPLGVSALSPFGMATVHWYSELPCCGWRPSPIVQLDLAAAETGLLTLLSQPSMARAMGAAAAAGLVICSRRRLSWLPMALFLELEQCRRKAPVDAHCARPVSPQLDPVRVFARFASHPSIAFQSVGESIHALPQSVQKQRAPLANSRAIPASFRAHWPRKDIICKHQQ